MWWSSKAIVVQGLFAAALAASPWWVAWRTPFIEAFHVAYLVVMVVVLFREQGEEVAGEDSDADGPKEPPHDDGSPNDVDGFATSKATIGSQRCRPMGRGRRGRSKE